MRRCSAADPTGTCRSRVSDSWACCRPATATRSYREMKPAIRRERRSSRSRRSRSGCRRFSPSFFGGSSILTVGAQAVAGFDQVVCDFTPIFGRNPFETPGMTYQQATGALVSASNDPVDQRRLIRLAGTQQNGAAFSRGDFGYLTPTTGSLPASPAAPLPEVA